MVLAIVTNSLMDLEKALPQQEKINSKEDFFVKVVIGCSYPSVNISWMFNDDQVSYKHYGFK